MLALLAILSMALGNITAIAQSNLKRMLAYSAIANMGFMLLGLLSGMVDGNWLNRDSAYSAALFYIIIYTVMSVGAFGMLCLLSRAGLDCENLEDAARPQPPQPLVRDAHAAAHAVARRLPPTAGFYAKLAVFNAAVSAGYIWLAVAAVLLSLVGAYYYLRIVKLMYFDEPRGRRRRRWRRRRVGVLHVGQRPRAAFLRHRARAADGPVHSCHRVALGDGTQGSGRSISSTASWSSTGALLKVRRDRVRLPDGTEGAREYIRHPGAVAVVALFDDGSVLLERQFRYPHRREFIEIPAGKLEPGEPHPRHREARAGRGDRLRRRGLALPRGDPHRDRVYRRGDPPLYRAEAVAHRAQARPGRVPGDPGEALRRGAAHDPRWRADRRQVRGSPLVGRALGPRRVGKLDDSARPAH